MSGSNDPPALRAAPPHDPAARWYVRAAWALTTAIAGLALTLLVVLLLRQSEAERFTTRFHRRASLLIGEFRRNLDHEAQIARNIAAIWDLSEAFTADIFERFHGRGLTGGARLRSLDYVERVPSLAREAFEQRMRPGGGRYVIHELDASGQAISAVRRPEHYPVAYHAFDQDGPDQGDAYGLDFAAWPDRLAAMERAKRGGVAASTCDHELRLFHPIYAGEELPATENERERRLEGFAVATLDVAKLVADSIDDSFLLELHLHVWTLGVDGKGERLVYPDDRAAAADAPTPARLLEDVHAYQDEWELAGQRWRAIAAPTLASREREGARWSWLALAAGLACTVAGTTAVTSATRERRRLSREVRQFWDLSTELLCVADRAGVLRRINPAWETLLGIEQHELVGRPLVELVHPDDRAATESLLGRLAARGATLQLEARLRATGGRWRWFQWSITSEDEGRTIHAIARDVTEQRHTFEELERRATIDPLTQVLTRRALFERLSLEIRRAKRYQTPLSIAVLDLDRFKEVNDRHGHAAGDELLRRLGQLLRQTQRDVDLAGRFGGDEFVIVMPQTDLDHARKAAARILRAFHERGAIKAADGSPIPLRASIGIATLTTDVKDATALVSLADDQLYTAKGRGRGRVA